MPRPDPLPRPDPVPRPTNALTGTLKRSFKLLGCFALLVAAVAAMLVARGEREVHIHMLIATALGVWLTVFIGGALTLLIFYSAASGHDEAASRYNPESDQ